MDFIGDWSSGAAAFRIGTWALLLKAPWCKPLFIERAGKAKHYGFFGWRARIQRAKFV